jgi:hypothetical protein
LNKPPKTLDLVEGGVIALPFGAEGMWRLDELALRSSSGGSKTELDEHELELVSSSGVGGDAVYDGPWELRRPEGERGTDPLDSVGSATSFRRDG